MLFIIHDRTNYMYIFKILDFTLWKGFVIFKDFFTAIANNQIKFDLEITLKKIVPSVMDTHTYLYH